MMNNAWNVAKMVCAATVTSGVALSQQMASGPGCHETFPTGDRDSGLRGRSFRFARFAAFHGAGAW
jgi:hypothetical protein